MSLTVEPLKSKNCLLGFRCGVKEIESFSKSAFKKHTKSYPEYRVRVLYKDGRAVGFYTLSMSRPDESGRALDAKSVYAGTSVFLYVDHFAIASADQGQGLSTTLMVDLIETLHGSVLTFGRVFAVGLNAADASAVSFFERWGFVKVSDSTNPFMLMDRESLIAMQQQIEEAA